MCVSSLMGICNGLILINCLRFFVYVEFSSKVAAAVGGMREVLILLGLLVVSVVSAPASCELII